MIKPLKDLVRLVLIGVSLARTGTSDKCKGVPVSSTRPKITVPPQYLLDGKPVKVACSVASTPNPNLWFAIYNGLYFTVLDTDDRTSVTTAVPNDANKCSYSIKSTRVLRMREHLDGAMVVCLTYAVPKGQEPKDCGRDDTRCVLSDPLKLSRSWPFLSMQGVLFITLVAGWTVLIVPIVIYLLWANTRDLRPSKLVDMGDSGNAQVTFA